MRGFLCLPVLALFAVAAVAQDARQKQAEGWHSLFDGSSTDAWRGYRKEGFPEKGWVVEDGALRHVKGAGGGDIITRRKYRNFELKLEWKVGPKANSGIMYGVEEGDRASYRTGPEYQVLDDLGHNAKGMHTSGALYALYTSPEKKVKPAGEWNTARIVMVGGRVEHWLNGGKVVDAQIGSDDWNVRVAKSKFAKWPEFGTVRRGHIALQDHGDDVWYRKIEIRELPPENARHGEEVVLFDGASMDGWSAHLRNDAAKLEDVWSVRDGAIVCKGRPPGYIFTKQDFKNFVLQVEWRWAAKPGNSGVLMRMTGDHRVWPRSIEAQLMSGSAGDFWNIGDVPMQVVKARTKGRNTKKTHGNEKPPGEWNRYDIVVDQGWVQLRVNGEVLNEAWGAEEVAGKICLQSEGAEIHFRNVRLVKLKP